MGTSMQPLGLTAAIELGVSSASGKFGGSHQYSCLENLLIHQKRLSTYVHRPFQVVLYLLLLKIIARVDFPLYSSFRVLLGV